MSIAKTILSQLGGSKFVAMTGAKNLVSGANSLQFSVGRNAIKASKVRITLDGDDTYTVEFFRVRGLDCELIVKHPNVYAEILAKFVGSVLGMATSL